MYAPLAGSYVHEFWPWSNVASNLFPHRRQQLCGSGASPRRKLQKDPDALAISLFHGWNGETQQIHDIML